MVITPPGRRIRLFGAAMCLACAGPALAQPVNDPCHLLGSLAEMTPHLDRLTRSVGGAHEDEALRAFDRALQRTPSARVTDIATSGGHLASRVPQLMAHLEALQALPREALQGNHAAVRAAGRSPEMRAGVALVQRLLVAQGCQPGGWFVAGTDADPAQRPAAASKVGAAGAADHVGLRALGGGTFLPFAVAALTAIALAAVAGIRALLRRRPKLSRTHPRYECVCWTTLEHGRKAHKSLIIDASRRGCRITRPPRFRRGTHVTLDVCGAPVSARVMWRREYFAGLRFAAALDEAQLAALHHSEQDIFGSDAAAGDERRSGAA